MIECVHTLADNLCVSIEERNLDFFVYTGKKNCSPSSSSPAQTRHTQFRRLRTTPLRTQVCVQYTHIIIKFFEHQGGSEPLNYLNFFLENFTTNTLTLSASLHLLIRCKGKMWQKQLSHSPRSRKKKDVLRKPNRKKEHCEWEIIAHAIHYEYVPFFYSHLKTLLRPSAASSTSSSSTLSACAISLERH